MDRKNVLINGATGYIGSRLASLLLADGHSVTGLCRGSSLPRLPSGCTGLTCNALDATTYAHHLPAFDTIVHLIGTSHPNPSKANLFTSVDLVSVQQLALALNQANAFPHVIYISVSHPAPLMKAYQQVRIQCEHILQNSGRTLTVLRPWYVLGPGHRWAAALKPFYALARLLPGKRDVVDKMNFVSIHNMLGALRYSVSNPPVTLRVLEIPEIRRFSA